MSSTLVSRSILLVLKPVETRDIVRLLSRALEDETLLSAAGIGFEDSALNVIANLSSGDVRQVLNRLEAAVATDQASG